MPLNIQGALVTKLSLGSFLTLSVRNGAQIERVGFWDAGGDPLSQNQNMLRKRDMS